MLKDLGVKPYTFPMPVLMIATYCDDGKVVECRHTAYGFRVLGEIVNVLADEKILDEKGKPDPKKLNALVFDQFQSGYYAIGEKVGQAWNAGVGLLKK